MLDQPSADNLRASLRGRVIEPGDADYDAARKVYNAMIDRRPRLIARCVDAADVVAALRFGREHDQLIAIRGGGHNAGGLGVCDDGLVIDLSAIRYARVDPEARTVRVGGGTTWGEVDHATHAFGLATPSGIISTTGVGGLTLGGGLGHLTRKCGLTIDNLLEADMVLADGSFVTVAPDRHPDLFWAIRGGGGNFGIVTSFVFRLHSVSTVVGGVMLWELAQTAEVAQWYADFIRTAPDDISGFFAMLEVPPAPPFPQHLHHRKMCGIVWCYAGQPDGFDEAFKPVRRFRPPAFEFVGPMPHPAIQGLFDGLYPPGLQWYWRADFVHDLSAGAIAEHAKFGAAIPTMHSSMHLYPINGAAHRVGKADTAWSYRDATWAMVIVGVDPDPANKDRIVGWARAYWDAVHPYSAPGAYVNFMMDEGEERIKATYRDNYGRLATIKRQYDPQNVFRVNQNIRPSASA
jgi:FAD/FMN-containing dehydrogenase